MTLFRLGRRSFFVGGMSAGLLPLLPTGLAAWAAPRAVEKAGAGPTLTPRVSRTSFFGADGPSTEVWGYDGVPGPVLRARQGERLRVPVVNGLPEPTTVHWHGLRVDNAMDGVAWLTQPPIAPGETFTYELALKDAGTFWYHPHANSAEQVGRGLYGALIVEETDPIPVDRDLVWILDDWRLQEDGSLAPFGGLHDAAHGGRFGNLPTINGQLGDLVPVTGGERLRLRLINAANARVFGLRFRGLTGWRIAVDSHPVGPESLGDEAVVVPPGGRVDLILDMTGAAGDLFDVEEGYYGGEAFALARFQVDDGAPVRPTPPPPPEPLAANPVTPPNLEAAEAHNMAFEGGAMGGLAQAEFQGKTMDLRQIAAMGLIWAVNGRVIAPMRADDPGDPMLSLRLGRSYRLTWTNRTAFDHPIHLHGHSFHVLSRNGKRLDRPVIMDTVLIPRGEEVEVVFVADNPGDWALHCHILEHAEAGMMGYVRVS